MFVCGDKLWRMTNLSHGLLEKLFCSIHISLFTQPRINQIAIPVDGPIQIAPRSMDFEVGLIDVPGSACLLTTSSVSSTSGQ